MPRLPGPRGPRPLGRALLQAGPGRGDPQAPGGAADQHGGPAVRPGLRGAHRARLPRTDGADTTVTEQGRHLMRLYSELDLVAAECLRRGLWDDLSASELAAALSVLVFEARRPDDASAPRMPGGRVKQVVAEMVTLWAELDALEREHHLDFLRQPDLGFAWAAYRWAEGDELDDVLTEVDLAAGDFVRWMKQLLDVAGQVADAAGDSPLREHRPRRRPGPAPRRGGLLRARRRLTTAAGWRGSPRPASGGARRRTRAPCVCSSSVARRPEVQHLVEHPVRAQPHLAQSSSSTQDRVSPRGGRRCGDTQPARAPRRSARGPASRAGPADASAASSTPSVRRRRRPRRPRTARRARPGVPPASTSTVTSQRAGRPRIA